MLLNKKKMTPNKDLRFPIQKGAQIEKSPPKIKFALKIKILDFSQLKNSPQKQICP